MSGSKLKAEHSASLHTAYFVLIEWVNANLSCQSVLMGLIETLESSLMKAWPSVECRFPFRDEMTTMACIKCMLCKDGLGVVVWWSMRSLDCQTLSCSRLLSWNVWSDGVNELGGGHANYHFTCPMRMWLSLKRTLHRVKRFVVFRQSLVSIRDYIHVKEGFWEVQHLNAGNGKKVMETKKNDCHQGDDDRAWRYFFVEQRVSVSKIATVFFQLL